MNADVFESLIGHINGEFIRTYGVMISDKTCEYFRGFNIDYIIHDRHTCPNCEKNTFSKNNVPSNAENYRNMMYYEQLAESGELTLSLVESIPKAWNFYRLASLPSINLRDFLKWIKCRSHSMEDITTGILQRPEVRADPFAFIRGYYERDDIIDWYIVVRRLNDW